LGLTPYFQIKEVESWLVVWNMNFMTFHSVGNFIIPTDELIFFKGVGIPPTRKCLTLDKELSTFHGKHQQFFMMVGILMNQPGLLIIKDCI
jgi:hypothetical protein